MYFSGGQSLVENQRKQIILLILIQFLSTVQITVCCGTLCSSLDRIQRLDILYANQNQALSIKTLL